MVVAGVFRNSGDGNVKNLLLTKPSRALVNPGILAGLWYGRWRCLLVMDKNIVLPDKQETHCSANKILPFRAELYQFSSYLAWDHARIGCRFSDLRAYNYIASLRAASSLMLLEKLTPPPVSVARLANLSVRCSAAVIGGLAYGSSRVD